jgi:hypothetical protein
MEFMTQLTKEHQAEVAEAHSWRCVECNLPAKFLVHQPCSYMDRKDDPLIVDLATPVCSTNPKCIQVVEVEKQKMGIQMMNGPICEYCGFIANAEGGTLKRCGRCKVARYCSSECQVADWPDHKKACRHGAATHKNDHTEK